jgi:hypothetical protein
MVRGTSFRGAPSRGAETAVGDTAEVVFLGELTGATGFGSSASGVGVSCKYVVVHGEHWHLARGDASGATQASHPSEHGGELAAWGHPVQLSFNTTSVQVRDPAVVEPRRTSHQRLLFLSKIHSNANAPTRDPP